MAVANNLSKLIKEGSAQLQLPRTVFYNPVQEFNRDLSVLVLKTYLKHNLWHHRSEERFVKARGGMRIFDALSASGLRSIRYAKELGEEMKVVKQIVANDLSEAAVELIKKNIELNGVQDKVTSNHADAAMFMHMSSTNYDDRFHVIDLDPFGTASQFIEPAVKSIGEAGLLMITCTDTAVLCGNASESCFARYGSMSIRADFCHDAALRIILRAAESQAAIHGRYIKPLLSISADFYVRLFMQVFTQQSETKKSASKLSQVYLCKSCKTPFFNRLGEVHLKENPKQANSNNAAVKYDFKPAEFTVGGSCGICGGHFSVAGPIWSDGIHDKPFLELLKSELSLEETQKSLSTFKRIQGIIYLCSEELDVPLFHSINHISATLRMPMPRTKDIMSGLLNAGYKVSSTHTNRNGLKSDAPNNVVWDIFCQIADKTCTSIASEDSLAYRIMNRQRDKEHDLTYNKRVEFESQKLSMVRFQVNPTRDWGPKPRPEKAHEDSTQIVQEQVNTDDGEGTNLTKRRKLSEPMKDVDDNNR